MNIFYSWHKSSGSIADLAQNYEYASRMVTTKKDWVLPICLLWPYTNDEGNWIFRFDKFEPIKFYLCSHSSCQCRLIYAQKNIETQTATKYFITGTKNFTLDLYPFAGNDALTGLVFWKNWYFSFTHRKYWLRLKTDLLWEQGDDMMLNNDLK